MYESGGYQSRLQSTEFCHSVEAMITGNEIIADNFIDVMTNERKLKKLKST